MKAAYIFVAVAILFAFASFTPGKDPVATEVKTGKYGVCGGDTANPSIELYLRADSTFRYYNMSYMQGTADLDGKWKVEKGVVVLYDYKSSFPIHNRWKIEEGNCLKSMKVNGTGMLFFRVCHLENCAGTGK